MACVIGRRLAHTLSAHEVHEVTTEHSDDVIGFEIIIANGTAESRRIYHVSFILHIHGFISIAKLTHVVIVHHVIIQLIQLIPEIIDVKRHVIAGGWHLSNVENEK